ncbi:hypothetical protein [Actinoplanes rectilineatus]|uniref:hypothetical protein n=1 Tax=Actinoplanes rectilineatus TaxID=113571 RepID=UPI000A9A9767|nr:hypothetical protein [Actinoplanes rectilineatus]
MDTAQVAAALAERDFGKWTRADLERVVTESGWRITGEKGQWPGLLVDTAGPATVHIELAGEHERWYGYQDGKSARVTQTVPDAEIEALHRSVMDALIAVVGEPSLVGGPGAWASWRLPEVRIKVSRERWGRRERGESRVLVDVLPRDASETEEYKRFEYDEWYEPDDLWNLDPDTTSPQSRTLLGTMVYDLKEVHTWEDFDKALRELFASFGADVPTHSRYIPSLIWAVSPPGESENFVQGRFAADEVHLEVWGESTITTTAGNGIPGITLPPGSAGGHQVADLALAAIRGWGLRSPGQLTHRAWVTTKNSRLTAHGFRIPGRRAG